MPKVLNKWLNTKIIKVQVLCFRNPVGTATIPEIANVFAALEREGISLCCGVGVPLRDIKNIQHLNEKFFRCLFCKHCFILI